MNSCTETQKRLIARFGWAAGLFEDEAAIREERLRRYRRALERIAAGAPDPAKIAARAIGAKSPPPQPARPLLRIIPWSGNRYR